jgi:hypothetical protein
MAAVSVRNGSDLDAKGAVAEKAVEESNGEERSAATAVAHGRECVRVRADVYYSCLYSYTVIQVRAVGVFEGAEDRGGEAQGTMTREFAGVTRIQMRRWEDKAMVVRLVMMMMMMYIEIEVVHCCSRQESDVRSQSRDGLVS